MKEQAMPTRVAIYARVSTINHGQDVSMQTRELRQFAELSTEGLLGQHFSHSLARDSSTTLSCGPYPGECPNAGMATIPGTISVQRLPVTRAGITESSQHRNDSWAGRVRGIMFQRASDRAPVPF
jgi:hypothetical protein